MKKHIFSRFEMEIRPADSPRDRTFCEGFNKALVLAASNWEDDHRRLLTALDCLYRLAVRGGLCPPGERRCEMDMAKERLAEAGLM